MRVWVSHIPNSMSLVVRVVQNSDVGFFSFILCRFNEVSNVVFGCSVGDEDTAFSVFGSGADVDSDAAKAGYEVELR